MAKITKSDVQKAIDGLRADNKNPTNKAIREFIGNGSNATINKYRKEILDGETTEVVKAVNTLSDEELQALSSVFSQLLINRTDKLGNEYKQRSDNDEKANAELSEQLDNANKQIEQLEQDKQQLIDDSKILINEQHKLQEQINAQSTELKGLYQKVGQVELLKEQLENARKELEKVRTDKKTGK